MKISPRCSRRRSRRSASRRVRRSRARSSRFGPEVAFVNVGGKGEATIEIDELKDADGDLEVAVGDRIQAMVVSTVGGLTLSRKLARGAATARQLEDAFHSGLPVEGKVERAVKGGYEVRIARQRAFCPFSQIDIVRTDPSAHEGQVYAFRIIEYKEGGRNLVVSRRALLEEEQRASAAEVRRSIVAGAVLTGRVASVREFGAFVDLGGGVQGLLHVSEMGWSRVSDPSQIVKPGEEITVKVLRVDDDTQKISLGLKQLMRRSVVERPGHLRSRPGAHRPRHARRGVRGVRRARAGDRRAGARLHVRADGAIGGVDRMVPPEMTGAFEILSIDLEKKRIGVALVPEGSARAGGRLIATGDRAGRAADGQGRASREVRRVRVPRPGKHRSDPVERDRRGQGRRMSPSVPRRRRRRGHRPRSRRRPGRRIRLSAKAVLAAHEAEEVREYTEREDAAPAEGFGSLADKLRGALKPREK